MSELGIVVLGLVIGWAVVSRLFALSPPQPDDVPDGEWHDVLGVPPDATPEQIDAAYEKKSRALAERELRIMTVPEQDRVTELRARLDAARRLGKERGPGTARD